MLRKSKWQDRKKRFEQLETHVRVSGTATFGFTPYPESEKINRVNRHFDSIANRYDLMNTLLSGGIHYLWKRIAVNALEIPPGAKVLDVCGGTGDMARMSASKSGKKGLSAVYDMNWKMMARGRKKKSGNVTFVQGDAEVISFHDETFDAVSIGFGIRNVTHMETALREIYRVLKKGGTFCCLEFSKPVNPFFRSFYDWYSFTVMPFLGQCITGSRQAYTAFPESIRSFPLPGELAGILRQTGFRKVRIRSLTNGIAVIHSGKK